MLYLLLFFFITGCSENDNSYFPLERKKSWSYKVEIEPEVEKKTTYKKVNLSLGKKKIEIDGKEKIIFPLLREDGSIFYYETDKNGIYRNGISFAKDKSINFSEKKRLVLPFPLDVGKKWEVESKTYLILKRYPYYDYRATTNFQINYEIISNNAIISTPLGKFKDCIFLIGEGETKFIGDSEIGSIKIKIISKEWYAKGVGLIKSERIEETDSDLFGTTKMTQILEDYKK